MSLVSVDWLVRAMKISSLVRIFRYWRTIRIRVSNLERSLVRTMKIEFNAQVANTIQARRSISISFLIEIITRLVSRLTMSQRLKCETTVGSESFSSVSFAISCQMMNKLIFRMAIQNGNCCRLSSHSVIHFYATKWYKISFRWTRALIVVSNVFKNNFLMILLGRLCRVANWIQQMVVVLIWVIVSGAIEMKENLLGKPIDIQVHDLPEYRINCSIVCWEQWQKPICKRKETLRSVRSSLEHRSTLRTSIFSSLFNRRFLLHFYFQSIKMPERSHLISRHSFSYIFFPHSPPTERNSGRKKSFPFFFVAKNNNNSMCCHSNRMENNEMRFDGFVCASPLLSLSH